MSLEFRNCHYVYKLAGAKKCYVRWNEKKTCWYQLIYMCYSCCISLIWHQVDLLSLNLKQGQESAHLHRVLRKSSHVPVLRLHLILLSFFQLNHQQDLGDQRDPDVIYNLLKCLKLLFLHAECLNKAARDHRGFLVWSQENLLIPKYCPFFLSVILEV